MSAEDKKLTIIVPTHDSYIDVFAIFFRLFKKYWPDCPYELVLSCNAFVPEEGQFEGVKIINNPEDCLITNRIYNAAVQYPSEYYLVLLEDMFFGKTVDTQRFESLISDLKKDCVSYCRLMPSETKKKLKLEYPPKCKPYAISLMGFICNTDFVEENFKENISGWDYEGLQLKKNLQYTKKERFESAVICTGNPLNLIHGIAKGKWIRSAYKKIRKRNPELDLSGREKLSVGATVKSRISSLSRVLSPKQRFKLKKFLSKLGFKFTTEY